MLIAAIKMLVGNRASCLGAIFGIFLASLLISQQSAIFLGLLARSYRIVTDIPAPNIWVMDPATQSDDKVRLMPEEYIDRVRSVENVDWAVPISRSMVPMVTGSGEFEVCELFGIEDASLIGAPKHMVEGSIRDLYREGGVIVDTHSANGVLGSTLADGTKVPLQLGDEFEINGRRAVVVGLCEATIGFYPRPIVFTTFSNYRQFNPASGGRIGFIAAHSSSSVDIETVTEHIQLVSGLRALTREEFKERIANFFLGTGILINFGLSVALGVIIGFSIAGQIFYSMTLENLTSYALMRALGATRRTIMQMILLQALIIGVLGFALGVGTALLWGIAIKNTTLAFLFPWQLLVCTAAIILFICLFSAVVSIRKVFHVDAKILMGN